MWLVSWLWPCVPSTSALTAPVCALLATRRAFLVEHSAVTGRRFSMDPEQIKMFTKIEIDSLNDLQNRYVTCGGGGLLLPCCDLRR